MNVITVREYEPLPEETSEEILEECRKLARGTRPDSPDRRNSQHVFSVDPNGRVKAQNYVGVLQLGDTQIEILPKINLTAGSNARFDDAERQIFFDMLRYWRRFRNTAEIDCTEIQHLKNFSMWDVFIHLFLQHLLKLVRYGVANRYEQRTGQLPSLKGRLQFPQQAVHSTTNLASFYVTHITFTADHPANRLIRTTLERLRSDQRENMRLRNQLLMHFDHVPPSKNISRDWNKVHIDRSLPHYEAVLEWVELFLFGHGLTTFRGDRHNKALLFPMQQIFEDYVSKHIEKRAQARGLQCFLQNQRTFARHLNGGDVPIRPDIRVRKGDRNTILDAKWKKFKPQEIESSDLYQMFAYGNTYENCEHVWLIYPKRSPDAQEVVLKFASPRSSDLRLHCFPFDLQNPETSATQILSAG